MRAAPVPPMPVLLLSVSLVAACAGKADPPTDSGGADGGADGGSDGGADGGSDGGADGGGGGGEVRMGEACPADQKLGEIYLVDQGATLYLGGRVADAVDPWVGAPALESAACAHFAYDAAACGGACPAGEVCGADGECTPQPRLRADVAVAVTIAGEAHEFSADASGGYLFGELPGAAAIDGLRLTVGGAAVDVPAMAVGGDLPDLTVVAAGDWDAPGELTVSWTPAPAGTVVRTLIPINHHAGAPTFTACAAPADAGGFTVPADMVNPLAVITGLEFQGCHHVGLAAVHLADGCVEVWAGTQILAFPAL